MSQSRKKKLVLISLIFLVTAVAVAAGAGSLHSREQSYVAFITKSTESAFFKSMFAGANAAATEYNVKVTCEGADTEENYAAQNVLIEQAVKNGADAIVFSAVDYHENAQVINEAAASGVKIVVVDSDVDSGQVLCRIGTDNRVAGRMAGEAALSWEAETLQIGIVNFDKNSANGQEREEGFRERVAEDARVKSVTTINVLSTTEDAREGTVQLLQEHPEINVVATFNEWTSLGVGWAIRDLDLQEKTHVVAFDNNVVSVGMLETGEVDALIVQNPYAMGYLGVETAVDLLQQKRPEAEQVDTETTLVTRENMYTPACQKILFAFD